MLILIEHYSQPNGNRSVHEQKKVDIVASIFNQFLEQKTQSLLNIIDLYLAFLIRNLKKVSSCLYVYFC
jgi:hypothetical protein